MNFTNTARASLVLASMLLAVAGCQKQEGPAERAGKELDQTVDKLGQQIEKAGDKIDDATRRQK